MSDNLKNDVKNAVPVGKKGSKIKEPVFKDPQFIMHCLTNHIVRGTTSEKELDTDEKFNTGDGSMYLNKSSKHKNITKK